MAVLNGLLDNPDTRALYLFPTKALAQDQLAELLATRRRGARRDSVPFIKGELEFLGLGATDGHWLVPNIVASFRTLAPCVRNDRIRSNSPGPKRRNAGRPIRFPARRACAIPAFNRSLGRTGRQPQSRSPSTGLPTRQICACVSSRILPCFSWRSTMQNHLYQNS